jgi:hypothetical protein
VPDTNEHLKRLRTERCPNGDLWSDYEVDCNSTVNLGHGGDKERRRELRKYARDLELQRRRKEREENSYAAMMGEAHDSVEKGAATAEFWDRVRHGDAP